MADETETITAQVQEGIEDLGAVAVQDGGNPVSDVKLWPTLISFKSTF